VGQQSCQFVSDSLSGHERQVTPVATDEVFGFPGQPKAQGGCQTDCSQRAHGIIADSAIGDRADETCGQVRQSAMVVDDSFRAANVRGHGVDCKITACQVRGKVWTPDLGHIHDQSLTITGGQDRAAGSALSVKRVVSAPQIVGQAPGHVEAIASHSQI
jgi:hypothetical protein